MLAEINRDKKRRRKPFEIDDFNPLVSQKDRRDRKRQSVPRLSRKQWLRVCVADLERHGKPVPESIRKELEADA